MAAKRGLRKLLGQVVHRDEAYTLAEFKARTQISDSAYELALESGLRVVTVNRENVFVSGEAWLTYLSQVART